MTHFSEILKNEIQLSEDECCIVFDFGCYFPYSNSNELTFKFSLGMEEFNDYKVNNRYKNKCYQTISKKYGRKISKIGYPYVMKLKEQNLILLCLNIGIRDKYITLVFPIHTKMTKDKPICALKFHYMFNKNEFYFISYEKTKDCSYHQHIWRNYKSEDKINSDNEILLNAPNIIDDNSNTLVYDDIIKPYELSLQDLLL
ncbi:hypothetical protein JJB75_14555 [Clostridium perfringens]|uniref:Uncharacterized protein n=1 Tax=Clostridium perfringens TaxID=1502 RepID=A0AAN5NCP2_CLOPF|nr:hypothetical protein [Clostridium perfringens]MBO3304375.1 hypothetical protein [Clostridium perfringens]MBO3307696.1 hypothetical protein [Clostridium perfringens]MBO3310986.1 hypothetical protein [Clostridium perfringens]MBO3317329.1 hypothetical protein [Clostridium perfringens]HAT4218997.1 hypothetical protein [Clostridium perfringens]